MSAEAPSSEPSGEPDPYQGEQGRPLPEPVKRTEFASNLARLASKEAVPIPPIIPLEPSPAERIILRDRLSELLNRVLNNNKDDRVLDNIRDFADYTLLRAMFGTGQVVVAAAGAAVRGRFVPKNKPTQEDKDAFLARKTAADQEARRVFDEACRYVMHPIATQTEQTLTDTAQQLLAERAAAAQEATKSESSAEEQPPTTQ